MNIISVYLLKNTNLYHKYKNQQTKLVYICDRLTEEASDRSGSRKKRRKIFVTKTCFRKRIFFLHIYFIEFRISKSYNLSASKF